MPASRRDRQVKKVHQSLKRLVQDHDERAQPIAFAGREDIICAIQDAVDRMTEKLSGGGTEFKGAPGGTFVIHGPPGAGKTALVGEIVRRLNCPCLIYEEVPDENDVRDLWDELATILTGLPLDEIRGTRYRERYGAAGISAIAKGEAGYKEGLTLDPLPITSCKQIRSLSDAPFRTPVLVSIDEIQNIKPGSAANDLVRHLHTQGIAPVLLICTGLSNSREHLQNVGISRLTLSRVIPLGGLAPDETRTASRSALGVIAGAGVTGSEDAIGSLCAKLADASDNWPRHLTCYLQGMCQALLDQESPSFGELDEEDVLNRGHRLRQAYYEDRLVASGLPASTLASVYERVQRNRVSRDECAGILINAIRSDASEQGTILRERFPSSDAIINRALRSGVLTSDSKNDCEIPIPPFAAFVFERARSEQV